MLTIPLRLWSNNCFKSHESMGTRFVLRLLPLVLLLGFGCSPDSSESAKNSSVHPLPLPETLTPGTAIGQGKLFKSGWSIAVWDNSVGGELIVGFLESEPTKNELSGIKKHGLFLAVHRTVPLIEFAIGFEEKNGGPDVTSPRYCNITYDNFGKGHRTLYNPIDQSNVVQISGDLKSGGKVKGRFIGTSDEYGWNFTFDLPVQ